MANQVDPALLSKLQQKLGIGPRQVNRKIEVKVAQLYVSRSAAAVAVAAENKINVSKYGDELRELSGQGRGQADVGLPPAPSVMERKPVRPRKVASPRSKTTIFVVHGRDEKLRQSMFNFLRTIGLNPQEWDKALASARKGTPYIGEVLDKAMTKASAVVVVLSPDDEVQLRAALRHRNDPAYEKKLTGQARPNVLFEAGMALGRLPDRTVIVQVGKVRPFSDIGGRHVLRLNNSASSRNSLANRLRTAGCDVDTGGNDWLQIGDFAPTLE